MHANMHEAKADPASLFKLSIFSDDFLPAVLKIERQAFDHPWDEASYRKLRAAKETFGFVIHEPAATPSECLGYIVGCVDGPKIHILNLAVRADFRRRGLGSLFVERVKQALHVQRFRRLICYVRERNLTAQLFLRSLGFRAVLIDPDFYDNGETAYLFVYHVREGVRS